jgi:hypothetical protein
MSGIPLVVSTEGSGRRLLAAGVWDVARMPRHIGFEDARRAVLTRELLDRNRWVDRDVRRALANGTLIRLHRNCYVLEADWAGRGGRGFR